jgi:U3 small nucleolar RNA-associated protein 15
MAHKAQAMAEARVPVVEGKDRTVVWNNAFVCYQQPMFGQVGSIRYGFTGNHIGVASTNQLTLLRVPQSDGCVWNDQSSRACASIRFRHDDKMVVKTVDQRVVVRSVETNFERQVAGHTRAVKDAMFVTNQTLASASDDTTVRVWDLISQKELAKGTAHTDYVRCLAHNTSEQDGSSFFSGSYDHTAMLWDVRTGMESAAQVFSVGAAIEDLLYVKGPNLLVTSSADVVSFFDLRNPSAPVHTLAAHTKAVTCLAYCPQRMTLITGSHDCRLMFTSLDPRQMMMPVAAKKFPHAVTAVDVHPDATEFAVGFANGDLEVLKIEEHKAEDTTDEFGVEAVAVSKEERSERTFQRYMTAIRTLIGNFRYQKALKSALLSNHDDVVLSTVQELQRRGCLRTGLSNQIDRAVVQLLRFASKMTGVPAHNGLGILLIDLILEIYGPKVSQSPYLHAELLKAHRRIGTILGALDTINSSAAVMEVIVSTTQ